MIHIYLLVVEHHYSNSFRSLLSSEAQMLYFKICSCVLMHAVVDDSPFTYLIHSVSCFLLICQSSAQVVLTFVDIPSMTFSILPPVFHHFA